jgi:GNAT superfamily N-acetyltransferase
MAERRRAFYTAVAMDNSEEVPGDLIGWYSNREPGVYAFLPVSEGQVTGFVVARKRDAFAYKRDNLVVLEDSLRPHWCIDRIWIYEPHRRKGIASAAVRAIARYFGENVENLAWLCPLTEGGRALARALSGDVVHLTA